ncbi:hypothetical protein BD626DRAFT_569339 [Schizophyllum amplum]|uniref:Uncharacterized protein n=1 Tax=Schizophyllum amplum TaxID=97359 RepID=A0A550CEW0_9AGAR|nr:hypothetical protein BD626DRAFT_569339 [Auriculariopsis ampla]
MHSGKMRLGARLAPTPHTGPARSILALSRRPAPRPILKFSYSCGPPASYPVAPAASARSASHEPFASASGPPTPSRGVHFPPSPRLTRTFSTHPPSDYDRSPIVVGPNTCALPERGGRTYTEEYAQGGDYLSARDGECMRNGEYLRSTRTDARASDTAYPRALPCYAPCPPLTPDASSESDDSDACASPPPVPAAATFGGMARPGHGLSVDLSISSALAFLPHPSPKTPLTPTSKTARRASSPRKSTSPSSSKRPSAYDENEDDDEGRAPTPTPRTCGPAAARRASSPATTRRSATPTRKSVPLLASTPASPTSAARPASTAKRIPPSTASARRPPSSASSPPSSTASAPSSPNPKPRRRRPVLNAASSFSVSPEEDCLGGF